MKHFLALKDHSKDILEKLLDMAIYFKNNRFDKDVLLKFRTVVLLFEKPSTRTRVSFEVAAFELGANTIYLGSESVKMGERESIEDVSRVLSRYIDMIVVRTFAHENLLKFAQCSDVSVINGLTDQCHPCQIMADLMTIREIYGTFKNLKIVYVGSANNILNSWLSASAIFGIHFVYSTPKQFTPQGQIVKDAMDLAENSSVSQFSYCEDPQQAVSNADIIYTDVWMGMGQEQSIDDSLKYFKPYQVNENLLKLAKKSVKVMHCLPAQRGLEVNHTILDSEHSIVFDQAENRLYVQKAIMSCLPLS